MSATVAVEQRAVGLPQRQAPQRIGLGAGRWRSSAARQRRRRCRRAPAARARARRARRRSAWRSRRSAPAALATRVGQRVAQDQRGPRRRCCRSRPSGPCACAITSTGRKALPDDGVLDRRHQHAQPHRQLARHDHAAPAPSACAAPPMSFFISRMPSAVLRSRPPVSKHTPLPTSVTLRCAALAPVQVDQPRRAACWRGRRRGSAG